MVTDSKDESCIICGLAKAGLTTLLESCFLGLCGLIISMIVRSEVEFCEMSLVIEFWIEMLPTDCDG